MMDYLKDLEAYRQREIQVYEALNLEEVNTVMNILEQARRRGRRIFIFGNGGSGATASHFCCDFNKGVGENKLIPYQFICLNDNIPTLTAIANDISYNDIFRYQLMHQCCKNDIVIGISGSGDSQNIINALEWAKVKDITTIGLVGYNGGKVAQIVDYCIHVKVDDMQITEDIHMILDHMMMSILSKQDDWEKENG